jgi:HD-GYP domain-containing protein (c-di-GMP phosphodiesterase class II)
MTTDRPYRAALSLTEALNELRACRGTQFDPHVVDRLLELHQGLEQTLKPSELLSAA